MFFIFFGTRPGKTINRQLNATCPYCGQHNSLTLEQTPEYFHLFWIPVFIISRHKMAFCSHCKRGYDASEFSVEMREAAKG